MFIGIRTFLIAFLLQSLAVTAANKVSIASGNWTTAGVWFPSGAPVAGDNITISAGHIVGMNANGACTNLTINGTANWTANRTVNVGGSLTMNNGGSITGAITGVFNIAGTMTVPSGASAAIGRTTITVSGATTISGTLTFNNTTGTKTFSDVTVVSGGTWTATVAVPFRINGNIINNSTFTANTGVYTLAGSAKTLGGSSNLIFNNTTISGSYANTGSLQINTNLGGTGTLTQGANSTLVLGDITPANILNASAAGNTVRYLVSGNMSTLDITYHHLIIEELGGTVNGAGTYTVNGNYSVVGGTASLSNVSIGGNITVNAGTTLNIGAGPTSISGSTTVNGTLNITSVTGTKMFGDLSVASGGTWNSTVAEAFTINGDVSNSGTFTANTGVYILTGTGKSISGTLTIPTLSVTGTYTNNATLTNSTALQGAGILTQGSAGILNIGATPANFSVGSFNASASGNTVNYNRAGIQNIRIPGDGSYHHLTLSGTGNKTLLGAVDINGNLTISSALVANNFNITLAGDWSSTGTFTAGTNTVTLDGTTQSITRTGGETFNHLVLSGSGTKTLGSAIITNGNLAVNSTLDVSASNFAIDVNGSWTNNGTFVSRGGGVLFSGAAAQTVGGTSTTNFYDLTQNNTTGVSLTQNQNLINALTISAGTFTTTGYNFVLKSDATGTARVATIPAGANFAGNLVMERYSGTGPTDWRFLTSGVSGATLAQWADDFATSGFAGSTDPDNSFVSIYTYDETQLGNLDTFGFVPATNVADPIVAGAGYWVYLGPGPVTFEVTGTPYTFNQSPTVTYTNSGNIANDGWNLIANPYPSAIDWDAASWAKANLDNAIYIYNSSTGSYASYVSGIGVNGGSRYVASSQAFWVKANAASPAITAVETVKASQGPAFFKQAYSPNISKQPMAFKDFPIPQNSNTMPGSLKLTAGGNGYEDETMIYFRQGASVDFDGAFDAYKIPNLNPVTPSIASVINSSLDLSINGYPDMTSDVSIPLRVLVPAAGTYSIRRDSVLMLPMSSCVFLEDIATGNMTDLRASISYTFTISDTTSFPRFLLHVYAPVTKKSISATCSNDSSGIAIAQGTGAGPWNYVWKNSSGSVMQTANSASGADTLFNLSAGVYSVQISGSACGTITDTVVIKSLSTLAVSVIRSNVTCYGLSDGNASASVSGGSPPFLYHWSNATSGSSVNNLSAGSYFLTLTDGMGCSQTMTFSLTQPSAVVAGFAISADTVDLLYNSSVLFTDNSAGATSFIWDFGDGSFPDTLKNTVHFYSQAGTYTATQTVFNGLCSDSVFAMIVVVDSLSTFGIGDPENFGKVKVAYNKGDVFLLFNLAKTADVGINLYNSIGELVGDQDLAGIRSESIRLDTFDLPTGIYLAMVRVKDHLFKLKIAVRK